MQTDFILVFFIFTLKVNFLPSSQIQAVEHLLALVATVPIDSSGRIALFSLGNLATHAGSKELLRSAGQSEILKVLSVARGCKDSQTVKYCERLLTKLNSSTT